MDPYSPTALVDFPDPDGEAGARQRWRFGRPARWLVALDPSQVPGLLDDAHALSRAGHWCVGWVAYEAAPGLDPHLPVKALPPGVPYAVWAVFDQGDAEPWPDEDNGLDEAGHAPPAADITALTSWQLGPWRRRPDDATLHAQIETVRELIRAGEVYQVNLTGRLSGAFEPDPQDPTASLHACFSALQRSQPQGYCLMLDARAACRTPGAVLSVSPELFFDWDGHRITARPMKGTSARSEQPEVDAAAADHLKCSDKERAENLMIVDLLRNDLSRVAEVGSVEVPSLFDVQALPTVWQMTSTVTARTRPATRLSEVFAALFPCGSVTGAPKRQAMHHIARLEPTPRGLYCGAVGIMAPGGRVTLNVPIRTVSIDTPPPAAPWTAHCGIGSGITLDATPEGEVREWHHKQAFLNRADQPFQLLESLRLDNGFFSRLPKHLARMSRAADHFGFIWDAHREHEVRNALQATALDHLTGTFKVRVLMGPSGPSLVEATPLDTTPPPPQGVPVVLADRPMPEADEFIRHKTTRRPAYEAFKAPPGCVDTLLYNARGELTEFTIGNVALQIGGRWLTPPVRCGLLPGVMRATLLAQNALAEQVLTLADLDRAEGLALINSVRGWVTADLAQLRRHRDGASASSAAPSIIPIPPPA
ncbi:MAG: bifunctional aminodeoxychorismate synthase component I/aminotransferase [Rubrivivax sp.]|nr:MAG: bifunctional aminodeoxychorismate synthase component I/aminotransferase [Rubrivivax sp.]